MSEETRKSSDKSTKSLPYTKQKLVIVLLIVLAISVLFFAVTASSFLSDKRLFLNDHKFDVTTADTAKERENGLSGWERLGEGQGMLFVYTDASQYCMWMKDMHFAIDIIWLDSNKKVISTKENATPDTYPEPFCPSGDARYVLEVSSGTVSRLGIKSGDQTNF